ncbi:MAG TPA: aldehyde ferredoxin oxidoreductase family protein [Spirochaetota bacterium]|nr:aldehyde ferredoxin oxidoreductase family protein [Spirochaetota bacterium]
MASKYKGYMGKIADINLSTGSVSEYPLSDEDREKYLGGRFIATKILWDELSPGADALSPENILIVMTSPLTGTGAPSSSRYDISAKSPLTGLIGHSNSGGNFGMHLKRAGFDGVVVRGKASKPVYIEFDNGSIHIRDAGNIWGMNTQDAQKAMGQGGTMAIGPAGENQVLFASVVSQERSHGRCGMGAVMGSKNLKGMVARGSEKVPLHNSEEFKKHVKQWITMLQKHPATGEFAPRYGTAGFLTALSMNNALPTKNFSKGSFDRAWNIGGERLAEEFLVKNSGCVSCPIRCGRVVEIDGKEVKGPEYEILSLLGSNMLIDDLDAIIKWNYQLDLLGLDAITTGTLMGFAAELNERGVWKCGIEFGKKDNISQIIEDIAYKRGIGPELSKGVRYLAKKFNAEDYAPHVKGLELAAYEPRASVGHGLGYATASRGACHLDGGYMIYFEVTGPVTLNPHHYRSKPSWTILDQNLLAAVSAGGNCLFTSWTFVPNIAYKVPGRKWLFSLLQFILTHTWILIDLTVKMPKWLMRFHVPLLPHTKAIELATGMKMDFGRYYLVGERGYTLERMFNIREGLTAKDDSLPARFTKEPLMFGKKGYIVPLDKMIKKYYKLRGWDDEGKPTKKLLKKLQIE